MAQASSARTHPSKMGVILAEMRGHNGDRRESVPFPRSLQHGHLCPLLDAYNVCLQYITAFKDTYRIFTG